MVKWSRVIYNVSVGAEVADLAGLVADYSQEEAVWFGLLELLRKHREHFVINTKWKGRAISEFVSLVSLLS
ncbi:FHA domain-containing protein FHA2-like [Hordeum vulgare]|nr:FHA domain-containing protein FHA2-like [Hordeum vulgare]